VQAVHSEFQQHLQSDGVRLEQVQYNAFAKDGHPAGKFGWGNRTVRDPTHAALFTLWTAQQQDQQQLHSTRA
jgi:secreted Zn-dependent insulinase-like peptidase